jgi:hypothetical protein
MEPEGSLLIHKRLPLVHNLSQINPVCVPPPISWRIISRNISLYLTKYDWLPVTFQMQMTNDNRT